MFNLVHKMVTVMLQSVNYPI